MLTDTDTTAPADPDIQRAGRYQALLNATPFAAPNGGVGLRLELADGSVTRMALDPWGVRHLVEILIEGLTDNLLRGNAAAPPTAQAGDTVMPPSYEPVQLRTVSQARADGVRLSVQTAAGRVRRLHLSLDEARALRVRINGVLNAYDSPIGWQSLDDPDIRRWLAQPLDLAGTGAGDHAQPGG